MKIQVWKRYAENRAKEPIEEGVYEQGEPKLYGLWRYLIDNGNARAVAESVNESFLVGADPPEAIEPVFDKKEVTEKPKRTRKAKS